jgi:copper transport protein
MVFVQSVRRRRGDARASATVALALGALLLAPPAASAHAILQDTSPPRGVDLKREPDAVVFKFSETVEGDFGAVRVFNAKGDRIDAGDAFHPGGTGSKIGVHLKPHLPDGTYTATYRVISADGHPVSSGFLFSIGKPGPTGEPVSKLLEKSKVGPVTDVVFGAAKAIEFAAIAVGVGGFFFLLILWPAALREVTGGSAGWREASEVFVRRLRRLLLASIVVGSLAAALAVVMQGAVAAGISGWSALEPRIVREVLHTHFGTIWGLAIPAWVLTGGLVLALLGMGRKLGPALKPAELGATGLALSRTRASAAVTALPLGFVLLVPALSGHATTQSPVAVMLPANVLHLVSMSIWLGGLVTLVAVLPGATRRLEQGDRTRLLAAVLTRFSAVALVVVVAILTTGLIQAYVEVRTLSHLLDTAFGRAVLIKICLLLALLGLGAYNRQRSVPRVKQLAADGAATGRAGLLLRRALRAEVALIAVVLGVTAALSSYAPSTAQQNGPFSTTKSLGPLQLQMTVDPARVGSNGVHLYFFNQRDGSQFTGAKQVTATALQQSKQIGPLPEQVNHSGPGHYTVSGVLLSAPGDWLFDITVRVSEFDEYVTKVEVPIR